MILKFASRSILKRPSLNLIKIIGLSLALSGILLIVLFLKNELTYDSYHEKSGRIYRFTITNPGFFEGKHFARLFSTGYIPLLADYFPEIENYVRLSPVRGGVIKHEEDYIVVNQAFECDSTYFQVFDSELLTGDPQNILNNPGSMVLSESFAKKIFGKVNPLGEILTLPAGQFYGKDIDFTVKGIMKDFPQNSHLHPDFITTPVDRSVIEAWAWTYLLLSENADPVKIESGFKDFFLTKVDDKAVEFNTEAHLQKISDIHLHSGKLREIEANSNMTVIYTLSLAALILLFIAITNYTNLNIGMADFSDKYLFISKVSGASKWLTLKYFLFEGLILVLASVAVSVLFTAFSIIAIKKYFLLDLFTANVPVILAAVILFGMLGIMAGVLPLLKQGIRNIRSSSLIKSDIPVRKGISKSIIVLQYTISIGLIIAVIVIHRQTRYALESSMSVRDDNLICFTNVHTTVQEKFSTFKEELLKYSSIELVSAMFEPPGGEANDMFPFTMEGYETGDSEKPDNMIGVFPCDNSLASIFKLEFLSGSNFSEKNIDNEGSGEYIINETAMRRLNYNDPAAITGKGFGLIFNQGDIKIPYGKIIGVVKDFHLSSIRKEIEPLVLFKRDKLWLINFVVSFRKEMQSVALGDIERVWKEMFPGYPFQYEFVSSIYKNVYRTELLQAKLLAIFTFISLFICSMGLLGLSLLTTQRRTKEIGIRKINGAGAGQIMVMLNSDFVRWIVVSFLLSIPLAVLAMNKWLSNFAYRTQLSWWIFALAGLSAIIIAVLTVSVQSWKASARNPVEALRYE